MLEQPASSAAVVAPWQRSHVPDSDRIGWPGEPQPGFVDACLQRAAHLRELGQDVLALPATDAEMAAYEAGIPSDRHEAHRAAIHSLTVSGTFIGELDALAATDRREMCVGAPSLRAPPRPCRSGA